MKVPELKKTSANGASDSGRYGVSPHPWAVGFTEPAMPSWHATGQQSGAKPFERARYNAVVDLTCRETGVNLWNFHDVGIASL